MVAQLHRFCATHIFVSYYRRSIALCLHVGAPATVLLAHVVAIASEHLPFLPQAALL